MPSAAPQPASERDRVDGPGELELTGGASGGAAVHEAAEVPARPSSAADHSVGHSAGYSAGHAGSDMDGLPVAVDDDSGSPRASAPEPGAQDADPAPRRSAPVPASRIRRAWVQLGRVPLLAIMLCVLCGLGIVQTLFHMGHGVYRSVTWTQETRETQAENDRLRRDIQVLQDARVQLNSPQYLEQLARCWGYVGRDDKVLVVENTPVTVGSNCDEYRLP